MSNTQISFIITSKRDSCYINKAIEAVKKVCVDNYEIIFTSERLYDDIDGSVKYIHTNLETSVQNYNEGYKHTSYDWICLLTDDILLVKDPRECFKQLPNTYPESHIFNIHISYPAIKTPHGFRYYVLYIPCLHKKIIQEEFAGRILSEAFKHHYVDHWSSIYLTLRYPDFKPITLTCTKDGELFTNFTHTEHDKLVYEKASREINNGNKYYGYNGLFELKI